MHRVSGCLPLPFTTLRGSRPLLAGTRRLDRRTLRRPLQSPPATALRRRPPRSRRAPVPLPAATGASDTTSFALICAICELTTAALAACASFRSCAPTPMAPRCAARCSVNVSCFTPAWWQPAIAQPLTDGAAPVSTRSSCSFASTPSCSPSRHTRARNRQSRTRYFHRATRHHPEGDSSRWHKELPRCRLPLGGAGLDSSTRSGFVSPARGISIRSCFLSRNLSFSF